VQSVEFGALNDLEQALNWMPIGGDSDFFRTKQAILAVSGDGVKIVAIEIEFIRDQALPTSAVGCPRACGGRLS
jgi:hypothetical protein